MTVERIALRESQLLIEDGIAQFSHQRPAARNALSAALRLDYPQMLDRVESDPNIRALVITGEGGSFCAGGDLKSMRERHTSANPQDRAPDGMRRRLLGMHAWMERLHSLEVPVVAAVDGAAMGAGFSIALVADFILASSRAVFCMSFAKIGLVPDLGAFYLLPRAVGLPMAKELALTARRVDAHEGQRLGFVHAVHEPEALLAEAMRFARRFVAGPRESAGLTKRLMNQSFETPFRALAEMEAQAQGIASTTPYHLAAVAGFLDGKPSMFDWDRNQA
ncbi:enoyl-CoA hydratase/isomerase family protein [Variovorax sp. J22P168]|uniref:enoyl-CoA hydratase/isomerase family protein n=1 Tax=Variovorax jilinensis TaxID=3053513 RepID=UPI002575BCE2|nr:enoyl-CoA hydratase/isomerase family protein [Variovorax sp. J22P168]MDM0015266.1 enoyl-CoA hydratase/isomerase family protein [Variovorax sp. J22P168]